ncbi:hypothetical protein BS47DRAFT_1343626 [Hydnum rufescens UP504]|uniref:Uncharacterized protein n=1 Tax=Hydnum rufescens UP504 TaxID=1448309 RepID=A0A9P6AXQ6_9AGAM|nr:hypothetical protein BS47DRAFT_1343626 [Hydnum rufescens UP504]
MAYLIHANHWLLSRVYAFIVEQGKGISPNIRLGGESIRLGSSSSDGPRIGGPRNTGADANDDPGQASGHYGGVSPSQRAGHLRKSVPPAFHQSSSLMSITGSPTGVAGTAGDSGQEMEVKDGEA